MTRNTLARLSATNYEYDQYRQYICADWNGLILPRGDFNSRDTADNLKKSGAFVPGIRPGDQTARYIDKILVRLTLAGAIYMVLVCLLPEFLVLKYNVPFYFGGTSLLIIVVVAMDFMAQVQSFVMQQQYGSLMKKANFKMGPTL